MSFHPVHVTLTTITQTQDSDTMEVFFRMYYDDFLRDYKVYDPQTKLEKISGSDSFPADLLNNYFSDKVRIYINNRLIAGKLLTVDIIDNEVFLKLFYLSTKAPKKIRIKNQVLTGLYTDQTNMVFISINKNEEALRLTPEHQNETLSLAN